MEALEVPMEHLHIVLNTCSLESTASTGITGMA